LKARRIENLDAIMAVAGVDVLFVGPFDLSTVLGISGQLDHPLLLETVGEIVQRAQASRLRWASGCLPRSRLAPGSSAASDDYGCQQRFDFMQGCRDFASKVKAQMTADRRPQTAEKS
jgi:4-hydroxy-2-oxoheptanedioate aldolase